MTVRGVAGRVTIATGAVVILALVLEVALAAAKINSRAVGVFDSRNGYSFVPGDYYVNHKEGFSEGRFNSHGFRDAERTWEKPSHTYRILVLGDSFVEAFNVPRERTFPALLEAALNAGAHGKRYEVLALGQSGFGTADAYMRYRNIGLRYTPDMVILAFYMGNDVRDNSKVLNLERVNFYFTRDASGDLVIDRSTLDRYARQLTWWHRVYQAVRRRSYLASLVTERLWMVREEFRWQQFKEAHASEPVASAVLDEFSDLNVYLAHPPQRWAEAWTITERGLLKFAREVEGHGTPFVLVTLGAAEQVEFELQPQLRQQYELPFDFDLPARRLRGFATQRGIALLDLVPAFRDYHRGTGVYLHGNGAVIDGHWNEAGHRLAAQEILTFLKARYDIPGE